jgi:hypothetical protein
MQLVSEVNEPNTAYATPPLRSYDVAIHRPRALLTPALRSWFRRTTVAGGAS